jgi:GntR family transcriptional regulator
VDAAAADDVGEAVRAGTVTMTLESHAEVEASEQVAGLLQLATGAPVLERVLLVAAGPATQLRIRSYLPLDLVRDTTLADREAVEARLADPDDPAWPGRSAGQLASIGIVVTAVHEAVSARMPLEDEARLFDAPAGTPVLTITRTMFAGDRPVEATVDLVLPSDRAIVEYLIPLT